MKLPQFRYCGNCGNCGKMLPLARNIAFRAVNGPVEPPEHAGSSDGEREDAAGRSWPPQGLLVGRYHNSHRFSLIYHNYS